MQIVGYPEEPMKLVLLTLVAALAGCAAPITVTTAQLSAASNWDACRYTTMGGTLAPMAQAEVNRRGVDCSPIYQAMTQQRANEAAALNNAAQYFNRPPPPRPMNCTSTRWGNQVETTCR
jgi:hypothetical protein